MVLNIAALASIKEIANIPAVNIRNEVALKKAFFEFKKKVNSKWYFESN